MLLKIGKILKGMWRAEFSVAWAWTGRLTRLPPKFSRSARRNEAAWSSVLFPLLQLPGDHDDILVSAVKLFKGTIDGCNLWIV